MSSFVKKRTSPEEVTGEDPSGLKNNQNLAYQTENEFIPGSLKVYLSGLRLANVDFTTGVDNKSFTLILNPNDPDRLNCPPQQDETLIIDYLKNIVCNH